MIKNKVDYLVKFHHITLKIYLVFAYLKTKSVFIKLLVNTLYNYYNVLNFRIVSMKWNLTCITCTIDLAYMTCVA